MKIGLIGLKGHHSVVLRGAAEFGGCEIVGIADDDTAAAEKLRKRDPLAANAQIYPDWRRLLDHAMLDVCIVGDENGKRAEQLIALAQLGTHIIAEKPLTTTLADLAKVKSALGKSKSQLTMLLTMRHEPKYGEARRLIQEGAIGDVCLATAQKSYRLEDRPEWFKFRERLGGTIPYIGIHAIDLIRWITGQDFTHVAAFHGQNGKRDQMGETESQASVLLQMKNGGSATARLDYLRPSAAATHGDDRLRIAGTEGVLELVQDNPNVLLITGKEGPKEIPPQPAPSLFSDYAQSLRDNRPSRIPAADCFYMTELVLQAREAADTGKVIALKT
jgi:predicted dehydrogenase